MIWLYLTFYKNNNIFFWIFANFFAFFKYRNLFQNFILFFIQLLIQIFIFCILKLIICSFKIWIIILHNFYLISKACLIQSSSFRFKIIIFFSFLMLSIFFYFIEEIILDILNKINLKFFLTPFINNHFNSPIIYYKI